MPPWLLHAALVWRRLEDVGGLDLVAVEGEPTHLEFIRCHAANKEIPEGCLILIEGVLGAADGHMFFEKANGPALD